jgi:tungstate transport system substrate-binding protein
MIQALIAVSSVVGALLVLSACGGGNSELILATTTSTENSGLLDVLIPLYEEQSGDSVKVIAVGSGAAMSMGERGDADVLLVHSPTAEQAFVDAGFGVERARVMFNDFVIVGPADDPAGIAGLDDAVEAFARLAATGGRFVSRGDDSGTHAKERALWVAADVEVPTGSAGYTESGQGMAATLTIAAETGAYTLTDRATWLSVSDPERLLLLVEGDEKLFNVYHVILVNPELHDAVSSEAGRRFRAFLLDAETQTLIGGFGRERYGQPLFTPYASESD